MPLSGTVGVDYAFAPGGLAGGAISVGNATQSFSLGGNFQQNEFAASLYSAFNFGPVWADIIGTYGGVHDNSNRIVPIGITLQGNTGNTSGSNASLAAETGYNFFAGPISHGPVAGILLQRVDIDGFTEADGFAAIGGFTALSFAAQVRDSAVSELGYQASADIGIWHPFAKIGWNHEFAANRTVTASLTSIVAPSFALPAVAFGTDWATATIGSAVNIGHGMTAYAAFTSEEGQTNVVNYGGQVGLNVALNALATPIVSK